MKRHKIPALIDLFELTEPGEIRAIANQPILGRDFKAAGCPINRLLLERSLAVLSFRRRRFPTMLPRDDAGRAQRQLQLWQSLSEQAKSIQTGPPQLDPLARWIRDPGTGTDVGILAQQLLGQLFSPHFTATEESWAAAKILVAAPRSNNPVKLVRLAWWLLSGRLARAKALLASMVEEDLSAVNAIGIAVHNLVKSLRHMQLLYADPAMRLSLTPEAAAEQCLFAPVSVYRQATAAGEIGGCPFPKDALFVFSIGAASRQPEGRSLVFMDDTWSQCPANLWVPAMLQGLWTRALRQ